MSRGGGRTRVVITVKDHGLKDLKRSLRGLDRAIVEVGIHGEAGSDEVLKAAANELGTDTIPERSFLRSTLNENRARYVAALGRLARKVATGETTMGAGLRLFGEVIQRDVVRKIDAITDPPLAESTVEAKGSDKPLIDTGTMRRNVRYVVRLE
jgi:hypothetical protein